MRPCAKRQECNSRFSGFKFEATPPASSRLAGRRQGFRYSDFVDSKSLSGSGEVRLRLAFCETIMTDALSEIPIFVCTRTEDQGAGLRDIDSTFLLLNFFLDMEGNDLPQKEIMTS